MMFSNTHPTPCWSIALNIEELVSYQIRMEITLLSFTAYHHQHSKVTAAQDLANIQLWPVRVYTTSFIQKLFHCLITGQHNKTLGA